MSSKRVQPAGEKPEAVNLRGRRAAAALVLALGVALLVLATISPQPLRGACILLGLVLALPALICLGVDLLLRRAVHAVQKARQRNN